MVDFNNETTVTRPAVDIERVLILQKREDFLQAYAEYNKYQRRGVAADTYALGSRLESLFLQIEAMLRDKMKPEEFLELRKKITTEKADEIIETFFILSGFLRSINLTKIDTRMGNLRNTEEQNKIKGWG